MDHSFIGFNPRPPGKAVFRLVPVRISYPWENVTEEFVYFMEDKKHKNRIKKVPRIIYNLPGVSLNDLFLPTMLHL